MNRFMYVLAFGFTSLPFVFADNEATRQELASLKGEWTVTRAEAQAVIPQEILKDLKPTWTFKPDGTAVWASHEPGQDAAEYSYHVDASKTPKTIDFTYVGPSKAVVGWKQFGIYKLAEGKMLLCLTQDTKAVEKDRPKKFAVINGTFLLTLVPAKK